MSYAGLGWTATAATVSLFSSYIQLIRDVRGAGSTAGKNPHVFGGMLFNCSWWLCYGLLKRDYSIVACNGLGELIALAGAGTFLTHAANADDYAYCRKLYGGVLGSAAALVAGGIVTLPVATLMSAVGFVSMTGSVVLFASPLTELRDIINRRDASSLSSFIIFFSIVATSLWTAYGLLLRDVYIALPNGLGVALSAGQAKLKLQYPGPGGAAPVGTSQGSSRKTTPREH